MTNVKRGLQAHGAAGPQGESVGGEHADHDSADDAELAYADMLADDGADAYEVRARCRWARTRRAR